MLWHAIQTPHQDRGPYFSSWPECRWRWWLIAASWLTPGWRQLPCPKSHPCQEGASDWFISLPTMVYPQKHSPMNFLHAPSQPAPWDSWPKIDIQDRYYYPLHENIGLDAQGNQHFPFHSAHRILLFNYIPLPLQSGTFRITETLSPNSYSQLY